MLVRLQDLTSLSMTVEDGSKHRITDLLVDPSRLESVSVVADTGGWFSGETATIGLDRLRQPDIANATWPARVLRSDLESSGDYRLDPSGRAGDRDLRSARDWTHEAGVEAEDGHAGRLMDLILETSDWRIRHLVLGTGGDTLPRHQRVVPADAVAGVEPDGTVRLRGTVDRVRDSPDLHEIDGLEGKWYNSVLAYYGIRT